MKVSCFALFLLGLLTAIATAEITLNSFPTTINPEGTYTLTWTATANYSYTIWLVRENVRGNEYAWSKILGLGTDLHFDTLSPSYTWTVPSNLSTNDLFALWVDAFPVHFNGANYWNLTEWFGVSSSDSDVVPTTSSATPSATHSGASSVPTSGASNGTTSIEHHNSISGGAIAGIVIGCLVALALIVAAILLVRRRKSRSTIKDREAQARANRLAPVMQSAAAYEMHGRDPALAKDTNV